MEEFINYATFSPGDVVPLEAGSQAALALYASHLRSTTHAKLLSNKGYSNVFSIKDEVLIKSGKYNVRQEADIMRFVAKRMSVPLPKVLGLYTSPTGRFFIVMEFVKGEPLHLAWPGLDDAGKQQIAADLKAAVAEMRGIRGTYIGSLDSGAVWGFHYVLEEEHSGPFETEEEFNEALLKVLDADYKHLTPMIREMLKVKCDHRIVFAHADLQMKNIMVHGSRISAIIDWESAGFYPEYWDYAIACLELPWDNVTLEDWPEYLQTAIDPYPVEAATISIIIDRILFGY